MAKNIEDALKREVPRSNLLKSELVRYAIAGVINTIVGFIVYSGSIKLLSTPFWLANLFAIFAGIICGYTLARLFVFENQKNGIHSNAWKYVVTIFFQYIVSTALIWILIQFGFNEIASYILTLPIAIALSFTLQKYWVFGDTTKVQPNGF